VLGVGGAGTVSQRSIVGAALAVVVFLHLPQLDLLLERLGQTAMAVLELGDLLLHQIVLLLQYSDLEIFAIRKAIFLFLSFYILWNILKKSIWPYLALHPSISFG
jgi:hypothetical protein